MFKYSTLIILLSLLFTGCVTNNEDFLFVHVSENTSNINFENTITENNEINIIDFQYCYNGGGVGIGDFNNDGLQDIVFTGNQVSSKIYLNNGKLTFTDISEKANFFTNTWVTGVSIVDINSDGWDDIYLSVGGANCTDNCQNLLFVNQGLTKNGVPKFIEEAKAYGLDDANYAQQAVFFDYDLDGDLDVYIVHNGNTTHDKNTPMPKRYLPNHLSDYLLKNETIQGVNHPVYINVSDRLNMNSKGFGLGVAINDFNGDNLPDIYVSNDFITDDILYINRASHTNENPTFIESSKAYLSHETYNAMGVDVADINNDTLPDILVLDMLPKAYKRQKMMLGSMNYDKFLLSQRNEYTPQYMHNTLQLSNGFLADKPLKSSELGFQKGIASTDWSWAPLMVDFDNDGDKDIYITNGYVKDITDLDFINYSNQNGIFGTPEAKSKRLKEAVAKLPGIHLPNFIYEQDDDTNFNDVSNTWIQNKESFSNGAAYADLDNDGDLDLIVNNNNEKAFILENRSRQKNNNNYLRILLKGGTHNSKAIGAKVTLYQNGTTQSHYQSVIRGYLSSVEPIVHFGIKDTVVDSLKIQWPNGKNSMHYKIAANQVLSLKQEDASEHSVFNKKRDFLFSMDTSLLKYNQKVLPLNEYLVQHLMVKQYTPKSPCVVAANIDNHMGDELFVGGTNGVPSSIWFQDEAGVYKVAQYLESNFDNSQAVFIDADADGDLDLYVGSGGNRHTKESRSYKDRLYLNNGKGFFEKAEGKLPEIIQSTGAIAATDFDKDGDVDVFIGARLTPKEYPSVPISSFLINESGVFKGAFKTIFSHLGMVTSAIWQDIDNDTWQDLIVVGEFMEITVFKNNRGTLQPMKITWLDENDQPMNTSGWWNKIKAADFDKDGDIDFVIGNQGTNSFMRPTQAKPVYLYTKDFDHNGSLDPILAKYFTTDKGEVLLPLQTRDDIMKQLSVLKNDYSTYESFASTSFQELLQIKKLASETVQASIFESSYVENLGNGKFKLRPLPATCQVAPIKDILVDDFDEDGKLDMLLVGNDKTAETHFGNQDALTGIFLKGKDDFFEVVPSKDSGFYVPEQSNHVIKLIDIKGKAFIIATQYNNEMKVFSQNR
ncbi:ASPIC/UnbV domain protein [Cellulophaga algicola DSM 14237]|uniref:ASPIC/UnbV domain protein n=1 Tax=Cellulophaga algicola (strain DSM 14237 / IC166 / ACAM 630) TaxID=688270 RepID=E6XE26_CELAD|nr:VCBS repeat-containing protein [Cellulophaga algicola]ADV48092.1 ASPIC/UnbV domain protein [Cellulophaga algicola DSM 14237]